MTKQDLKQIIEALLDQIYLTSAWEDACDGEDPQLLADVEAAERALGMQPEARS